MLLPVGSVCVLSSGCGGIRGQRRQYLGFVWCCNLKTIKLLLINGVRASAPQEQEELFTGVMGRLRNVVELFKQTKGPLQNQQPKGDKRGCSTGE